MRPGRGEACSGGERGRVEQEARGPGQARASEEKGRRAGRAARQRRERKEEGERKRKEEKEKGKWEKEKEKEGREGEDERSPAGFAAAAVTRSATRNVACARGRGYRKKVGVGNQTLGMERGIPGKGLGF